MSPGPLLTYTIIKSVQTSKRGYLMGLWIIIGHAILELGIIILLLLGFSFILKNIIVIRIVGIVGGLILVFFGLSIVRDVYFGNISVDFLNSPDMQNHEAASSISRGLENPVIGGIVVSMSNPYWWVWWATIGLAFMIQFDISFRQWPKLVAFFLGHEAGDLNLVLDCFNPFIFWPQASEQESLLWNSCILRHIYDYFRYIPGHFSIFSRWHVTHSFFNVCT
jgi:threonine/homoserine/homoserine lactone efflux protein